MILHAWRIVDAEFASDAFTGEGARIYGGRWNSKGIPMVYCASTLSLATLEILVHLTSDDILREFVQCEAAFDDRLVQNAGPLPADWRASPPPAQLKTIGDLWVANRSSAVLRVPSTVTRSEDNYLLNPRHPDFKHIRIRPKQTIKLDQRLKNGR